MNRFLITGASGMLGKSLCSVFSDHLALKGRKDLDLTDTPSVESFLENKKFDVIIHSAAYTNLNFCEENEEKSFILHSEIVPLLSSRCSLFIYISTNPSGSEKVYYRSKRQGEEKCLKETNNSVVVRTNIYGKGGLVDWAVQSLKRKEQINGNSDVIFNAVHVKQLSNILFRLISSNYFTQRGGETKNRTINIGGDYSLSKYDFLKIVSQFLNLDSSLITPLNTERSSLLVPRDDRVLSPSLSEGLCFLKKDYE